MISSLLLFSMTLLMLLLLMMMSEFASWWTSWSLCDEHDICNYNSSSCSASDSDYHNVGRRWRLPDCSIVHHQLGNNEDAPSINWTASNLWQAARRWVVKFQRDCLDQPSIRACPIFQLETTSDTSNKHISIGRQHLRNSTKHPLPTTIHEVSRIRTLHNRSFKKMIGDDDDESLAIRVIAEKRFKRCADPMFVSDPVLYNLIQIGRLSSSLSSSSSVKMAFAVCNFYRITLYSLQLFDCSITALLSHRGIDRGSKEGTIRSFFFQGAEIG